MAEDRDKLTKNDELEQDDNDVEAHSWSDRGKLGGEDGERGKYGEDGERAKLT